MKVPKDFADMGGDIGDMGDMGDMGVSSGRGDGGRPENRCGCVILPLGESNEGSFGMPWLESGGNLPDFVEDIEGDRAWEREVADSVEDGAGSMTICMYTTTRRMTNLVTNETQVYKGDDTRPPGQRVAVTAKPEGVSSRDQ